jgi:hypothetical protein
MLRSACDLQVFDYCGLHVLDWDVGPVASGSVTGIGLTTSV